jgi:hypothetical protein
MCRIVCPFQNSSSRRTSSDEKLVFANVIELMDRRLFENYKLISSKGKCIVFYKIAVSFHYLISESQEGHDEFASREENDDFAFSTHSLRRSL